MNQAKNNSDTKKSVRKLGSEKKAWYQMISGLGISLIIHAILLAILAFLTLPAIPLIYEIIFQPGMDENRALDITEQHIDSDLTIGNFDTNDIYVETSTSTPEIQLTKEVRPDNPVVDSMDYNLASVTPITTSDLLKVEQGGIRSNELSGRTTSKGTLLAQGGGSEGSERSVAMALDWLARHQLSNGSWSFDHTLKTECEDDCRHVGKKAYRVDRQTRELVKQNDFFGATGMALLPFLGAGHTHQSGKYQETVYRGLQFLVQNMEKTPDGGSLWDPAGQMYSQGLATMALCEAYAMTHDKKLKGPAQEAIRYIVNAQNQAGGGWRYRPGELGDTSVFGWQMMALKSASLGELYIPDETWEKASFFLNRVVAYDDGAGYGYTNSKRQGEVSKGTTSIGLLSQMYLGWRRNNPSLQRGVQEILGYGPDLNNIYYSYYATLVLHHYGGEEWDKWNRQMRDSLIKAQEIEGHKRGSWFQISAEDRDIPSGEMRGLSQEEREELESINTGRGHHASGGRLYYTAMACMILEVYYRYLPLYRQNLPQDFLPLY